MRFNSSIKSTEAGAWLPLSKYHYLEDAEILNTVSMQTTKLRAFAFDARTSFVVLTLPPTSIYRKPERYSRLKELFAQRQITLCPYKAAGSDDIHLYIFFDDDVDTAVVSQSLINLIKQAGMQAGNEITACTTNSVYSFPLQKGFVWLDDKLQPIQQRDKLTLQQALDLFVADLITHKCSADQLNSKPDQAAKFSDYSAPVALVAQEIPAISIADTSSEDVESFAEFFEPEAWAAISESLNLNLDSENATVNNSASSANSETAPELHLCDEQAPEFVDKLFTQDTHTTEEPCQETEKQEKLASILSVQIAAPGDEAEVPTEHLANQLVLFPERKRSRATKSSLRSTKATNKNIHDESRAPPDTG